MVNGKEGDHPLTDLLLHGLHPFPPDIEDLILRIRKLDPNATFDGFSMKMFEWEQGKDLAEARDLLGRKLKSLESRK